MKNKKEKLSKAEKRKIKLENRKKRIKKMTAVSVMIIAIICLGVFYTVFMKGNSSIQEIIQTNPRIPLSEIGNDAKFYTYSTNEIGVRYFAVKGSDGDVHVALDACDICYDAKKGYTQIGAVMHCINCGREYPINSIGTENIWGGCWPSFIPMTIDGNDVVIEKSDLEAKMYMFQ